MRFALYYGPLVFLVILAGGVLGIRLGLVFSPSPPVVDQCHVDPDCTTLKWIDSQNPVCVGPRSKRCDP